MHGVGAKRSSRKNAVLSKHHQVVGPWVESLAHGKIAAVSSAILKGFGPAS